MKLANLLILALSLFIGATSTPASVLKPESFRHFVDQFNQYDRELFVQFIPNTNAWNFLQENMPLFDCPDKEMEEIYYFRWWTYRKAIQQTSDGFVITEFLPKVGWAGKYNTINCAASHHFHEGRWLKDPRFLDDYARFWLRKGGSVRNYSFPVADAIWARCQVTGDYRTAQELLPDLIVNYEEWEKDHHDANGLYWQVDDLDGMEVSISGDLQAKHEGYRVTINSYQYADALAIANIAELAGQKDDAAKFRAKAAEIRRLVQEKLWDPQAQFFKVLPRGQSTQLSDAREEHGYTPWFYNLPDAGKEAAWKQLMDPQGFYAPYGPTTAEQRHPKYAISYRDHECQWNGPSWPFSTSITLSGMANLLNNYRQDAVSRKDYFELLKIYTKSHHRTREDGRVVPWIDENINPTNGDWIARTRLKTWENGTWSAALGGEERGKDYNHSTYCDLIINGLIGLRPRTDDTIEVNPLVPAETWDYFCLDRAFYHGHWLTILWDKTGQHYNQGKGLRVFADDKEIAKADSLSRVTGSLPTANTASVDVPTTGGWTKYEGNPVMGGKYGTCFDISVLKETNTYRMWLSWRPKQSVALVESTDGVHWSEPPQIVLGSRKETGWEDDINRPVVLRREDGYHMWYTGQAERNHDGGHSWIGYATSPDGVHWTRKSEKPVLTFEAPWEKVAVMCPHVIWDASASQYRMWYSGGEQNEPNAIGYATSSDGITWKKHPSNPIFRPDSSHEWEQFKVTAAQVERRGDWYYMFYIGFRDEEHAQIGLARSRDGITQWQRHAENPIVRAGKNQWDHDACYKPYAIFDGRKWLLWYNGRHGGLEQIGVVFHEGEDLGFSKP